MRYDSGCVVALWASRQRPDVVETHIASMYTSFLERTGAWRLVRFGGDASLVSDTLAFSKIYGTCTTGVIGDAGLPSAERRGIT